MKRMLKDQCCVCGFETLGIEGMDVHFPIIACNPKMAIRKREVKRIKAAHKSA